MLEAFLLTNTPLVVLFDDVSATTRIETLQPSLLATPTTSVGSSPGRETSNRPGRETSSDIVNLSGAKRRAETVSSRDNSRASESIGVQRPRRGLYDDATTAHVERSGD